MDERTRLDQVLDTEAADVAKPQRRQWQAPVIDIVPLKNAAASGGTGADGSTQSC